MALRLFTPNESGVGDLLDSSDMFAMLRSRAEAVLAAARASAPVETGAYRDSLHLVEDTTDRAVVHIAADVPYAMIVESRTGTLARALDAAR